MIEPKLPYLDFLGFLKGAKNFSEHSLRAYEIDLRQFFAFLSTEFHFSEKKKENASAAITQKMVRSWVASLLTEKKKSRSVHRKLSSLKAFFKYEMQQNRISDSPCEGVPLPKIPERLPKSLKTKNLNELLDLHYFGEGFRLKRDRIVIALLYGTGMRTSELINLKTVDVFLSEKKLKVVGKGNKERIIPFTEVLNEEIRDYLFWRDNEALENADWQFLILTNKGKKVYPKFISRITNNYLSLVTTNEQRNPHLLRHTYATALLNNGADLNAIKSLLGHSSLAATQVYTHNSIEKLKSIYKFAHPKSKNL